MKVLITGASGFVGKHLLKKLVSNSSVEIFCLSRRTVLPEVKAISKKIKIVKGDIRASKDVVSVTKDMDAIIHLAASVSSTDTKMNYEVNVLGAKNIVDACKKNGIKRVIFTSTFMATKEKKCNYGLTKMQAEQVFNKSGLDITILRPTLVYGKGGKGFTKIVKNVKAIPFLIPLIGSGKFRRQPVFVMDVVDAIVSCLKEKKSIGKSYYLGGPSTITFKEMVKTIAERLNVKKIIIPLPSSLCMLMAWVLEKVLPNPPITRRNIISINQHTKVNIKPTEKDLDFNPISFEEGVKRLL